MSNFSFTSENLFQAPERWTATHLQGLNVQEHHRLPAATIIGDRHLPNDDDPLFMALSCDFAGPTRKELLTDPNYPGNKCGMALSEVDSAWECFKAGHPPQAELISIARTFECLTDTSSRLRFSHRSIPFHISSFAVKGLLRNDGAFFESTDLELSLPLTIFLAGKDPECLGIAHEVAPYLLFQTFLAYEKNHSLDEYNTFVVSMKGTIIQFVRASCSNSYLQDLAYRKGPGSLLELYFSEPYDLLEQEDRKEFVRIFVGLVNYLYDLLDILDS